jgi:hypothetical protein
MATKTEQPKTEQSTSEHPDTGQPPRRAVAGDWVEVNGLPGRPARRGQVLEIVGDPGHERYRVRWDEKHESVFFPTEGVHVLPVEK